MRVMMTLAILVWLWAGPALAQTMDAADQRRVLSGAADLIEASYVDAAVGARVAANLRGDADAGRFVAFTDPVAFAAALQTRLRGLTGDGHFGVEYRDPSRARTSEAAIADDETERWYGRHVNHGFEAVRRLEQGVGYLDLRVFAPTDLGGDLASAAMSLLAESPALIIDLRRNGGGMGEMVHFLAAYLFEGSVEMSGVYDRPSNRHSRAFTPSWVPGRRFGSMKPVYILVSPRTFSAAENFAYDLQALGRAVIVGEPTGGGAHPFAYRAIDDRFVLALPEGRSINPVTGGDWEGQGVQPDVRVPADDALDHALALALEGMAKAGVAPRPAQ